MKFALEYKKKDGFTFKGQENLNDALHQELLLDECKLNENFILTIFKGFSRNRNLVKSNLTLDLLHNNRSESLSSTPVISKLLSYGAEIEGLNEAENVYKKVKQKNDLMGGKIKDYINTDHFMKAKEKVQQFYDGVLNDGSSLFDYQVECASLIVGRRRLLNGLDMGLGKTRTTIVGLTADIRNKKILIVTMSRNVHDWVNEIHALGLSDDFIILQNRSDMNSSKRIHLVSYERWAKEVVKYRTVLDDEESRYGPDNLPSYCPSCNHKWEGTKTSCKCGETLFESRKKPLYKYFNRSYDACAVDEGHLFKNGATSRCKSIMAIKTKTRVVLSGTPAEGGASDLFWLLAWLMGDSHYFWNKLDYSRFEAFEGYGERSFRVTYGGVSKTALVDSSSISKRASNVEELWAMQDLIMYRKLKKDPLIERTIRVPKPVHRRLHLEQTASEKELYQKVVADFAEWFKEMKRERQVAISKGFKYKSRTIEVCAWLEKLRLAASCPWLHASYDSNALVPPSKLTFVREQMQQSARFKQKMLIFTAHKKTCEELGVLLDACVPGYEVGYIHGGVPMSRRQELLTRFQDENDPLSVLIMTMKTGAESYTLTRAKKVILFDLDYNAKKIEQCYSRAVRLGQQDVVEVTWLISVDTIDANMHSLVLSKQSSADLAVDRQELDFTEIAKEFDGQGVSGVGSLNYEDFASEMLSRGTSRKEYEVV